MDTGLRKYSVSSTHYEHHNITHGTENSDTTHRGTTMYTRDPEMAYALVFIVCAFVYAGVLILLSETAHYI